MLTQEEIDRVNANTLEIMQQIFQDHTKEELEIQIANAQKIISNQALEKSTINPYDFSSNINYSGYEGL